MVSNVFCLFNYPKLFFRRERAITRPCIVPVTKVYTLRVNLTVFPPLLYELVNYSDFAGCQVENSLANVVINIFRSSVLELVVIFELMLAVCEIFLKVLGVTNGREIYITSMICRYYSKIHNSLDNDRLLKIK